MKATNGDLVATIFLAAEDLTEPTKIMEKIRKIKKKVRQTGCLKTQTNSTIG
jgi:hypothetical protein